MNLHCDPILEMAISQDDLRAMYERLERNRARVKPYFSGYEPYKAPPVQEIVQVKNLIRSKYRNIKVEYEGMKFDSKHELECWKNLKLRERAGELRSLNRQIRYDLIVNGKKVGRFTADFTFEEKCDHGAWAIIIADAKSPPTRKEKAYRLRKKLFESLYAPLVIREL